MLESHPAGRLATQLGALALDEWRHLSRSRLGRGTALAAAVLTLLPLAAYLWVRQRYLVPWPVEPTVVVLYLGSHRVVTLILVVAMVHDLLSRGDREGWQHGFAAMPVGELTWLAGRAAGRLSWVLAALTLPWLVGWGAASLWAGRALDAVPFVSAIIRGPLLGAAMGFPVGVLAGCLGSSLVGTLTVILAGTFILGPTLATAASRLHIIDLGLPMPSGEGDGLTRLAPLAMEVFDRPFDHEAVDAFMVEAVPDPGRAWPPLRLAGQDAWALRGTAAAWALLLAAAPAMLRLHRTPGRWRPRVPGLPTFSRAVADAVDLTRPAQPCGRAARGVMLAGAVALAAVAAESAVTAARAWAAQADVLSNLRAVPARRPPPATFLPERRELRLEVTGDGRLAGHAVVAGAVLGRHDRAVPFGLARGLEVAAVCDGAGRALSWQRQGDVVWVSPPGAGAATLVFDYAGVPQRTREPDGLEEWYMSQDPRGWPLLRPLVSRQAGRRFLRSTGDLRWAPVPLADSSRGDATEEPCWGATTLKAHLPAGLRPVPLPGAWREEVSGRGLRVTWQGVCPRLPAITAGAFRRAERTGSPPITAVVAGSGTDLEGLLDASERAWSALPPMTALDGLVLASLAPTGSSGWWEGATGHMWQLVYGWYDDLPDSLPVGFVEVSPYAAELRRLPAGPERAELQIGDAVLGARAYARHAAVAGKLQRGDAVARTLLWQVCTGLERSLAPPDRFTTYRPRLARKLEEQTAFRKVDLRRAQPGEAVAWYGARSKLAVVATALQAALGGGELDAGLGRAAAAPGPLDTDALWHELLGPRARELEWLTAEVLWGRGIARPHLDAVEVTGERPPYRVRIVVHNDGDALTVAPVRLLAQGRATDLRLRVAPGETVERTVELPDRPDQVLVDPDGRILRAANVTALRWTPAGGLR